MVDPPLKLALFNIEQGGLYNGCTCASQVRAYPLLVLWLHPPYGDSSLIHLCLFGWSMKSELAQQLIHTSVLPFIQQHVCITSARRSRNANAPNLRKPVRLTTAIIMSKWAIQSFSFHLIWTRSLISSSLNLVVEKLGVAHSEVVVEKLWFGGRVASIKFWRFREGMVEWSSQRWERIVIVKDRRCVRVVGYWRSRESMVLNRN